MHQERTSDLKKGFGLISSALCLPQLCSLSIEFPAVTGSISTSDLDWMQSRASPVRFLRFSNLNSMNSDVLNPILNSITALEHLTFDAMVCTTCIDFGTQHKLILDDISNAISRHMDSLVELNIAGSSTFTFSRPTHFGAFRQYRRLRRLTIPHTFLYTDQNISPVETLPLGLEELQIQYNSAYGNEVRRAVMEHLGQLAEDKEHSRLILRRVVWWDRYPQLWADGPFRSRDKIVPTENLRQDAGIIFEFTRSKSWEKTPFGLKEARRGFRRGI